MNFKPTTLKLKTTIIASVISLIVLYFILNREYQKMIASNPYIGLVLSVDWFSVTIFVFIIFILIYVVWSLIQKKR